MLILVKIVGITALVGLGMSLSGSVSANDDEEVYSTEAYCLLQKENVDTRYLKAYAKKLGVVPSHRTCRSFLKFAESMRPKEWHYPQGRPYPGSVIRLSKAQIEKIKAAKNEN